VTTPVLYHIEISHFNEKARKPTFPVLKLNGKAIGDSTRIIEALERDYPEPPLYPSDPGDRQRALALEDFFDEELGPYIRRWIFYEALEELEPDEWVDGTMGNAPGAVKRVMRVTSPVASRLVKLRYGARAEEAEEARAKTEAAFDRVEQELQPNGYLVGDRFTVADLTAAALLFPLVRPSEAPFKFEARFPDRVARFQNEMSKRRGYQWVEETYRRHRGTSAALVK
jgi:glutathione S-transferase